MSSKAHRSTVSHGHHAIQSNPIEQHAISIEKLYAFDNLGTGDRAASVVELFQAHHLFFDHPRAGAG
jgi:hypothetical protein